MQPEKRNTKGRERRTNVAYQSAKSSPSLSASVRSLRERLTQIERRIGLLQDSVDHLSQGLPDKVQNSSAVPVDIAHCPNEFIRCGEGWEISFGGETKLVFHRRGMSYLALLLGNPGKDYTPLYFVTLENAHLMKSMSTRSMKDDGLSGQDQPSRDNLSDKRTLEDVHKRLIQIAQEIDDAREANDSGRAAQLESERESELEYVRNDETKYGHLRRFSDAAGRARKAVGKCIRSAFKAIRDAGHVSLASHLEQTIIHPSGTNIAYTPDKPIPWRVSSTSPLPTR